MILVFEHFNLLGRQACCERGYSRSHCGLPEGKFQGSVCLEPIENLCHASSLSEAVLRGIARYDGSKAAEALDNSQRQVITLNSSVAVQSNATFYSSTSRVFSTHICGGPPRCRLDPRVRFDLRRKQEIVSPELIYMMR